MSPDGSIVFPDETYDVNPYRLRRIHSAFPAYAAGLGVTTTIPSLDGSELYGFNVGGTHLFTYDATTGATKLAFSYNPGSNTLASIADYVTGQTTSFTYSGSTVTIADQLGHTTKLTLDGTAEAAYPAGPGRVVQVTNPNTSEVTYLAYAHGDGLLTSLKDPVGGTPHTFQYDANGLLIQDTDPTGASKLLYRSSPTTAVTDAGIVQASQSWTTAITNGAGDVATHQVQMLANNTSVYTDSAPSGATRTYTHTSGDLRTVVAPDGTKTTTVMGPDPLYGILDPIATSVTTTTPSGLQSVMMRSRTLGVSSPPTITDTVTRGPASGSGQLVTTSVYTPSSPASSGGTVLRTTSLTGTSLSRSVQTTLDGFGRTLQVQPVTCSGGTCVPAQAPGSSPSVAMAATTSAYGGAMGRVSETTVGGRSWIYTYDGSGNLATAKDPILNETQYLTYDFDGRVTETELPDGVTFSQSYDLNGNLQSISVPPATGVSSKHSFTYTPLNLLAAYDPPQTAPADGGAPLTTLNTSYLYDKDQNVLTVSVPEGPGYDVVQNLYDAYGRLSSTYDPISSVTSTRTYVTTPHVTAQLEIVTTSDGVTTTNSYDGFLRTSTVTSSSLFTDATIGWAYDALLRPYEFIVADSASNGVIVELAYNDPDGLYTGTLSSPQFTVSRDASTGLATTATLGIVQEAWTYDAFGAPASLTVTNTSTNAVIYAMSGTSTHGTPVGRDGNGRLTSMTETNNGATHVWSFQYDARGRLWIATEDGTSRTYGYDSNGNLTTQNGVVYGTYDGQDRLRTWKVGSGTNNITYTNNGDMASSVGGVANYTYDLQRNLRAASQISGPAGTIAYTIDGLNHRVGKKWTAGSTSVEEGLVYDQQDRIIGEFAGTGSSLGFNSAFVYGLKTNVPDFMLQNNAGSVSSYVIVSDWRGSVRAVVNSATGAIAQSFDYDEWGTITTSTGDACTTTPCLSLQPFRFAGGLYEPLTGFTRFGARDYSALLRRWTQKDPIRFQGEDTNLYAYSADDPINQFDPTGTITWKCAQGLNKACAVACGKGWNPACLTVCFAAELAAATVDPSYCQDNSKDTCNCVCVDTGIGVQTLGQMTVAKCTADCAAIPSTGCVYPTKKGVCL